MCASITSSSVHITNSGFLWTRLHSLFVLQGASHSPQTSSSITLVGCTLDNSEQRLAPIVEDIRGGGGSESFDLDIVGTRIANTKVIGADGIGVAQPSQSGISSNFEGICTTFSELSFSNVSSLPGTVRPVSPLFSQRMVGCGIWGSNNHLSGSTLRDMNGGGGFVCSNSSFNWCLTTSSERPSLSPHTPTLSSSLAPTNTPDSPAEEGDSEDDPFTGTVYDGVTRLRYTDMAVTFTRCWFFNMVLNTDSSSTPEGGSALLYQGVLDVNLTLCKFENCTLCSKTSKQPIFAGCVGIRPLHQSTSNPTATVDSCSFQNWYPTSTTSQTHNGGAIGTNNSAHHLHIVDSNFTLTGDPTKTKNGGSISHLPHSGGGLRITNCRLIADEKTTGSTVNFVPTVKTTCYFEISDTDFKGIKSTIILKQINPSRQLAFVRTKFSGSLGWSSIFSPVDPIMILDCVMDQTYHSFVTRVSANILISGTTFTGTYDRYSQIYIEQPSRHLFLHQCIFSECSQNGRALVNTKSISSLTIDSCTFTDCGASNSEEFFSLVDTPFFAHSCTFNNLIGSRSSILFFDGGNSFFMDNCRFLLQQAYYNDFVLTGDGILLLNESSVVGCTANRTITANSISSKVACPFFKEVTSEPETNKMRVGTWPAEEGFSDHSSLSAALATLSDESLLPNIVFLSEGPHFEASLLEIKHDVEIVGTGSNTTNFHCTELSTAGFKPKSGGKLTLRSMKLIPSTLSTTLAVMDEDVSLLFTRTFIDGVSGQTVSLILLTSGTTQISHSSFTDILSSDVLITVSGSASLILKNTYFVTITRTSPKPSPVEATQCASCVEGKTSGEVTIVFSRFGVCTTNGRAGVIDLEGAGDSSSVEMEWNKFDQNLAGIDVDSSLKGDDVVLNNFAESQLTLNLATQQSFPSAHTFLINSIHPIIPPPGILWMISDGIDIPLNWADSNTMPSIFTDQITLQYLLSDRLRNNAHTLIKTDFDYNETMTPFTMENSSVQVRFVQAFNSILTVEQTDQVFCGLINSSLNFTLVTLSFNILENSAFVLDPLSSLFLQQVTLTMKVTSPLIAPFIDSEGLTLDLTSITLPATLTLDDVPFVQTKRSQRDGVFVWLSTNPPISALKSLTTSPFINVEGMANATIKTISIKPSSVTHMQVSIVNAVNCDFTLEVTEISNLKSSSDGCVLHADNCTITISAKSSSTYKTLSARNGGVFFCVDSTFETSSNCIFTGCSASNGGVLFAKDSQVCLIGKFTSCSAAEDGGAAHLCSSNLVLRTASFVSNVAKRGGALFVELKGDNHVKPLYTSYESTFTNNTAADVVDGVDGGKGGAVYVKGETTADRPLFFSVDHFEGNKARFGNDVFVEESVLGSDGPTRLSNCGGESYSAFPHLEIENHNTTQAQLDQISDFIPFPTLKVRNDGTLTESCKWSTQRCKTLHFALQYLRTSYPNGTLYHRDLLQESLTMTTDPLVLTDQDVLLYAINTYYSDNYTVTLVSAYDSSDAVIFTIEDRSRLVMNGVKLHLKPKHGAVKITSKEGKLDVFNYSIISTAATTSAISPISSVGISLILSLVTFSPPAKTSPSVYDVPLVSFTPQPSEDDEHGLPSFEMTNSIFTNLTFKDTTIIEVETTGDVTFTTLKLTNVISDQQTGKYLTLKGRSFKTQLKPEQWDEDLQTKQHLTSLWGEDISMDESEKWRRGSLVYWLVSPSSEVVIGEDDDAVDHPNCGSSTFKCTTLDSAFTSAGKNAINTISFSVSTTLSTSLSVDSSITLKSSSEERRTITLNDTSSMTINTPLKTLSLTSLIFTVAATCSSATLFVVENGEMKFSSCLIGSSDRLSPLVVPAKTTKLIDVKSDGTLTLIDTLIQHITFTHATLGTALHLHSDSTLSFTGTTKMREITSSGKGSHLVISSSTGLDSTSISSLASQIEPLGPSTPNGARFSPSEIDEFVVIDSNGEVEELIYHWHPYDSKTLFVDRTGGIHSKCGLSVLPCSSISKNADKVGVGEAIVVSSDITEKVGFTSSQELSVKSSDNTNKVLTVANTASFTTQTSPLSFTSISFIPLPKSSNQNTDTNTRTGSLFIVESGSLSLTSCSVSSFSLSSSPLITLTSGTLILQSCSVSSITRSSGNGTVLSTEMSTGKRLLLDEIEFSSMSSSKDSPILALSFPPFDESNPDPLFAFTLTNLSFNSMTGMESEPPCFISLVGHDLASWIEVGDDRFADSYTKDSGLDHYSSFDETLELPASLLFYLLPSSGPVGVSDSGYNVSKCGSNSVWCRTITLSLTRLSDQHTDEIVVMTRASLSSSISLPNGVRLSGNDSVNLSTLQVFDEGSFVTIGTNTASISILVLSLPSTQTAEAVIVHSSTKLTLSNLELSSTSESSARFLKVTAGKAEMSEIEIRSSMASNSILFWILGGTVTASQFHVECGIAPNGTIVHIEGGSLSLTGMTATSSKPIEGRLVSLTNAVLNVTDLKLTKQTFTNALLEMSSFGESTISDMNISECSGWTMLTVRDGDSLTIRNSVFSSLTAPTRLNFGENSDLCVWERSLIEIEGTPTSLSNAVLMHIPQGAISISDAPLSLSGCTFSSNSPSNLEWPSLRRNVKYTNGTVNVNTIHAGDGHSSPHLWMWTSECSVMKDDEIEHSPLFIPTLSNKSSSTLDNKQKFYSVSIVGTMMIPCGLSLEVFEAGFESKSNSGKPLPFEISSLSPSKWTETELLFVLPQSSLLTLDKNLDHRCRLVFGDGQTTDSFSLIGNGKGNMSQGGVITSIVIPIVAVILVALLLIIIVIVLCRRRKMKKNASEKDNQELDTTDAVDVMKDEDDAPNSTLEPIIGTSTGRVHEHSLLMISQAKEQDRLIHGPDGTPVVPLHFGDTQHVEAVRCDEKEGVVQVDPRNTLYHRLHVEKKVDFDKKRMGVQITQGLERMLTTSPFSEVFSRLSPHWIILDQSNNVFLRIEDLPNQLSHAKQTTTSQSKNGEDRRWNAPEQDTEEGNEANMKPIDRTKVSVFRLGLVLWELETELVPFGELDAVNASRQMKAGVMPLIHNWADESFADLVRECLSLAPDERPTLGDVKSRLESLNSNAPVADQPRRNNGEAAASKLLSN
ncbi:hypothetical protein BLNAU_16924 [Blattamonas nauphoetae]|uniref:Protein kinase domain-containing protein n=1 Tax=Blattamonas nauphoetae TaxID=2049346 RepID=A0ABQ9X8V5_9EUKA|nr:hypothetical protein BLNAU_16924 [Blattamonas nauphoetae]